MYSGQSLFKTKSSGEAANFIPEGEYFNEKDEVNDTWSNSGFDYSDRKQSFSAMVGGPAAEGFDQRCFGRVRLPDRGRE
jgi:hypothetical protein